MFQGFLVAAALFGGELMGALVQLRSHLDGFVSRAAEGDEDLGKLGDFHGEKTDWWIIGLMDEWVSSMKAPPIHTSTNPAKITSAIPPEQFSR
jgi:hypothetical protein